MNFIKHIILTIFVLALPLTITLGQNPNIVDVKIKTSAQCGMCKKAIEETLAFERGVRNAVLDLKTKIVTVQYDLRRTSPEKIRKAISKIGYDADDVPADKEAYEKLAPCCKKPDDPNHRPH